MTHSLSSSHLKPASSLAEFKCAAPIEHKHRITLWDLLCNCNCKKHRLSSRAQAAAAAAEAVSPRRQAGLAISHAIVTASQQPVKKLLKQHRPGWVAKLTGRFSSLR